MNLEAQWVLVAAWLVGALRPRGPYPILLVTGEQGTAKSTTCRMFRRLIDPSAADVRAIPRSEHDLAVTAASSWIVAFDNVSRIQPWFSDALCRLLTGSGFSTRRLYTNRDEEIFFATRPVMLNGIGILGAQADLLDRV